MSAKAGYEANATRVAETVRRKFALIIVCGLLGLLASWYVAQSFTQTHTGTTQVYVYPLEGNPYSPGGANDELTSLETEAEIVGSDVVMDEVSQQTDVPVRELRARHQVTVPANTQLLDISFEDEDPDAAAATAEALAEAYLQYRAERTETLITRRIESIDDRLEEVTAQLPPLLREDVPAAEAEFNAALRRALNSEIINLRAQRVDLVADRSEPGRVTSESQVDGGGSLLPALVLAAGLLAGLLLGVSLALALERRSGRLWTAGDIRALGLPVLADMTTGRRRAASVSPGIRRVRGAVLEAPPPRSVIAVAPCGKVAEQGIARLLSPSFARAGKEVVMVDAEQAPEPFVSRPKNQSGLTDLLSGRERDTLSSVSATDTPGVAFLPRGEFLAEANDYFLSETLHSVLQPLTQRFDHVVVRTPTLNSQEGEAVAKASDVTIIVLTSGRVRRQELSHVVEWAATASTRILGVVIVPRNGVTSRRGGDKAPFSGRGASAESPIADGRSPSTVRS